MSRLLRFCFVQPAGIGLVLLGLSAIASAQYKITGPDGKVIGYSDRPPANADLKVKPIGAGGAGSDDVSLPFELRQAVSHYPVTLYTASDCAPCDSARAWLRGRGVPFNERTVTPDDIDALVRLTGDRNLPAVTIGSQALRGWSGDEWASYVDAAGYPKASQLPPNYRFAAATPLGSRQPASTARPTPGARPAPPAPPSASDDNPTGIRF